MMRSDGGQMMYGAMMWMMALGWIFILALTVLAIAATVWLIRSPRRPRPEARPGGDHARAELDLKYARGEVEREEYLRRKDDLSR